MVSKILISVGLLVLIITSVTVAFKRYEQVITQNESLRADVLRLKIAVETENAATQQALARIDEFDVALKQHRKDVAELALKSDDILQETRKNADVLAKHTLSTLLTRKQTLTLRAVNRGTARTLRLLERSTARTGARNADAAPHAAKK